MPSIIKPTLTRLSLLACSLAVLAWTTGFSGRADPGSASPPQPADAYGATIRPLLVKYCITCHSTKAKKGSLDLERFAAVADIRQDLKPWQQAVEMLETGEMPPKDKPGPSADERQRLVAWVRGFLDAEARARAGDPGYVPLRRLSNTQYDSTLRELTGVDLRPTREFPADGAAGEGFTNAAEALTDISPALLTKYLNAAKDVADHAVLLPDGLRFSPSKTRRDWTDEGTARLREFYAAHAPIGGRLPVQPYLAATIRHRDALVGGKVTVADVAAKEKLNPKYFAVLWRALTDKTPSYPLDAIRGRWRTATEKDVAALAAEISGLQAALGKTVRIGSYIQPAGKGYAESLTRLVASDPAAVNSQLVRLAVKPAPGQSEVVLYLGTRELGPAAGTHTIWHRPRFEATGKPLLLLRDYSKFGPAFEVNIADLFADSAKYLAAVADLTHDRNIADDDLAKKYELDAPLLKRWVAVLALEPDKPETDPAKTWGPGAPIALLEEKALKIGKKPAINGWRRKGADLPYIITNASDRLEQVPGRVSPRAVAVHPTPKEFVAVAWTSPLAGDVQAALRIVHAHPACGNGVAWRLEQRRAGRALVLAKGALERGGEDKPAARTITVEVGDQIILAVDAKNHDHTCDLTEINLTVAVDGSPDRTWDLAADVADTVLDGNPHADRQGNKGVWSFVRGPSKSTVTPVVPPESVLGRWRRANVDPAQRGDAAKLARQVQALLTGPPPSAKGKGPDDDLYAALTALDGPLLKGLDFARLTKARPAGRIYGLPSERFGKHPRGAEVDDASLVTPADAVTELRLPAALLREREFVVEGRLDDPAGNRVVQFRVLTTAPVPNSSTLDPKLPVVSAPDSEGYRRLLRGYAEFRAVFPLFVCFPPVIPTDEIISLKLFHREDEPLMRLFLDDEHQRRLDRLWAEQRFVSRQPAAENDYLPQFIGFVAQDQPKEMVVYFQGQRPAFQKRADAFLKEEEAASSRQLDALFDFAGRAYRRPLTDKEQAELRKLYQALRDKGVAHDEAFRGVLARVLVAPAFLFRVEQAPPGAKPGPVNDWELATRLSYFLWSCGPDEELRRLAAAGRLRDPAVLAEQTRRLLRDDRVRALAVEFGTQWIHVRGFDELKEKNEKLFPTFDAGLRQAIYEESILFFQDLFQNDRAVTQILDADYTFLNEALAKHYDIPGVAGPEWRRVAEVKKYGRGGILGLASVQAKQAGASRTSPVLRGNWVVETLLGEKLPRPPANVPQLPEEESGADKLTMRQLVEKHAQVPQCAVCHQRIDPFGFALERYDPIGRLRQQDLGGLPIDARATLKDGSEFDGIDGLRTYLLTKKKDVVVRLFCRRLLGYALGRSVALSDHALLDEMVAALNTHDGRLSAAVLTIVGSQQFRMIRGRECLE